MFSKNTSIEYMKQKSVGNIHIRNTLCLIKTHLLEYKKTKQKTNTTFCNIRIFKSIGVKRFLDARGELFNLDIIIVIQCHLFLIECSPPMVTFQVDYRGHHHVGPHLCTPLVKSVLHILFSI